MTRSGLQRPKMTRAMATQPRPAVMLSRNRPSWAMIRTAPPRPPITPDTSRAHQRIRSTLTPAASAASGRSPTARTERPNRVRYKTHQTAPTARMEMYTSRFWSNSTAPTPGIEPSTGIFKDGRVSKRGGVVVTPKSLP